MFRWFRRQKKKSKAMVFVDYEYWFYSFATQFGLRPTPSTWRAELDSEYDILDIMVFADFSQPGLRSELNNIRSITNTIIETSDDFQQNRKDMTDFVMLDYIYQTVDTNKKVDTYILFTGDGHFQSVVKYLTQKKHKQVIIYGIEESFSQRLKSVATKAIMMPVTKEMYESYALFVIQDLAYCAERNTIIPTIRTTTDAVSRHYHFPMEQIRATITWMLDQHYLYQRDHRVSFNDSVKIIVPDWELLIEKGIWDAEKAQVRGLRDKRPRIDRANTSQTTNLESDSKLVAMKRG